MDDQITPEAVATYEHDLIPGECQITYGKQTAPIAVAVPEGWLETLAELFDTDGGEGSTCYDSLRMVAARDKLRAMLSAAPKAQADPLCVVVDQMKESNGRVTWFVRLSKSPSDAPWDGHQVYASEVEGRALYEAALLRHFLGQGPAPDILTFNTEAEPAQAQELPVLHVGDTRFEGWLSEHQISDVMGSKLPRYHKQDMRDAYWAGYAEAIRARSQS